MAKNNDVIIACSSDVSFDFDARFETDIRKY